MSETQQRAEQYLKWSAQAEHSGRSADALMYADAALALLRPKGAGASTLEDTLCGYVYAMRRERGPVKIGFAEVLRTRFRAIARRCRGSLRIEDCLCVRHADMREVELFAHRQLGPYRLTPKGEWFSAEPASVHTVFDLVIAQFDRAKRSAEPYDF